MSPGVVKRDLYYFSSFQEFHTFLWKKK